MTISSTVKIAQKSFKVKYFPDDSEVLTKYDNYYLIICHWDQEKPKPTKQKKTQSPQTMNKRKQAKTILHEFYNFK